MILGSVQSETQTQPELLNRETITCAYGRVRPIPREGSRPTHVERSTGGQRYQSRGVAHVENIGRDSPYRSRSTPPGVPRSQFQVRSSERKASRPTPLGRNGLTPPKLSRPNPINDFGATLSICRHPISKYFSAWTMAEFASVANRTGVLDRVW